MIQASENRVLLSYLTNIRLSILMLAGGWCYVPTAIAADSVHKISVQVVCPPSTNPKEAHYRSACEHVTAEFSQHPSLRIIENTTAELPPDHLILVRPQADVVAQTASRYPGSKLTVIDAEAVSLPKTARFVHFRNQEGAFLLGMIAALTSSTGTIGFVGESDTASLNDIAYGFHQGAKYASPQLNVMSDIATAEQRVGALFNKQINSEADQIFVAATDGLPDILATARKFHRRVMLLEASATESDHPAVATSMVRHPDFALRDALLAIEQNRWTSGAVELGVREGYLDYMLNQENKSVLSHEIIERVENARDLIIQGALTVKPYTRP